ncbi:N-acetyltransferase [Flexivirga oryzae]|uniref:N-acetyltransferase n=1 Tax=Flexivirga oryzae TaxID=1794944 RepID=A0A839NCQ8_9MICO|nr:N-acetyltransferase [Flexivirga oryzae]MBB2894093.1 hypothetical protein [Flexivirga oryzae]
MPTDPSQRLLHPVGRLLERAAAGEPPPADGTWSRERPWSATVYGVLTFTGHAVLCVPDSVTDADLAGLHPDGFGGAADPRLIVALAGQRGWIDSLDLVLSAPGLVGRPQWLVPRPDLADQPRALRAAGLRTATRVFGLADRDDAILTIGNGIGGLRELSFELDPTSRDSGLGRRLIADARHLIVPDEIVLASVAPGNIASMRATLAAGFRPLAGVQLFRPDVASGGDT